MSRYHLTRELETLGFQASPFSFFHPLHEIVVEHVPTGRYNKRPWTVEVAGRWLVRGRSQSARRRRFADVEEAAKAGLRACGHKHRYLPRSLKMKRKMTSA